MKKSDDIVFDNIFPKDLGKSYKKINFHDNNDLINNFNKEESKKFAKKINLFFFIIIFAFIIFIIINLFTLSLSEKKIQLFNDKHKISRGEIVDRNGEVLATSINTKDLYLDTKKILDSENLIEKLKMIFPEKQLSLDTKKKKYLLIKKHLSLNEINELKKIGDPSIAFQNSKKRIYPQHNIFSHITGFKINNLKSKLEKKFDNKLSNGNDIKLTVDLKIQNIVREELIKGMEIYEAKSALSIVMNVENGEIVAMVSLPDFDPNYPNTIQAFTENNLATEARYEMGSTLKMFNAALALESNKKLVDKKFDISKGYQITNDKNITDDHINSDLINFNEVFIYSSNVASAEIMENIEIDEQKKMFHKIGLTEKLEIQGLNIVPNRSPKFWNETSSKFMSYGYGISLSPISLITSFASLVNGGFKIMPNIVDGNKVYEKKRVISYETSQKINFLLEQIVLKGTGKKANVNGLELGGKTGTSKKVEKGKYSEKKVITSFIGVFPVKKPNYITLVLFDEPKRNTETSLENFGSNTAAPTFSKIVRKISPILNKNNYFKYSNNEIK